MEPVTIPTLLFWENKNTWYGSKGLARFFIRPVTVPPPEDEPETPPSSILEVELWRGPLTRQLSEVLETASFPMTEEGLLQLTQWLEACAAKLNT